MSLEWILLGLRIVTTLILCTFLGLAFYVIWRDLKSAEAHPAVRAAVTHQLRLIAPAISDPLTAGDALPLLPVTFLGRDPENTIVVADTSASERHACLSRENGVWWLEDLGSQHGTLLNDLPLSKPAPLTNGDVIGIGNLRFRLETAS